MFDHLKRLGEKQGEGAPSGAPLLASLAEQSRPSWESPPPPPCEVETQWLADQAEGEEPALAEPFAGAVGPPRLRPMRKGQRLIKRPAGPKLQISPEQRLLILDTWRRSGLPAADFSTIVSIPTHTLYSWKKRFEQEGPAGLMDRPRGGRKGSKLPDLTKRTILMLKESNPDWGCQQISDMLVRGPALPASPTAVARVLKETGYELEEVPTHRHPDRVRRFERARSNQLWQTDLFTFVLKRQNRRLYLVGFMDDHSRFVVGYGLRVGRLGAGGVAGGDRLLWAAGRDPHRQWPPVRHVAWQEPVHQRVGAAGDPAGGVASQTSADAGQDRAVLGDDVAGMPPAGGVPGPGRRAATDRFVH